MQPSIIRIATYVVLTATLSHLASAQLSWDPAVSGGTALGGSGTWDTTTGNWWNNATNTAWDNSGATPANFSDTGSNQIISLDSGLTIGDLSYAGGNILQLKGLVDNQVLTIKSGGATWDTGGGQIEFLSNQTADVLLTMDDDTLTVNGGGEFDTGEKPAGANWAVGLSTLDIPTATTLRGNTGTVGQFSTVKLAGGSTYLHERNADQGYANNWELGAGAGTVRLNSRFSRQVTMTGIFSGDGTLEVKNNNFNEGQQNFSVFLNNAANDFTGGVIVDSSTAVSILAVNDAGSWGAVPVSFDADNITLKNDGVLRMAAQTLDANRGITLDSGGIILAAGSVGYAGVISGDGGFQLGRPGGTENSILTLSGDNTYTGGTQIYRGFLVVGADETLPAENVLTIGGAGTSKLVLGGNSQTIGGLNTAGNNTRQVVNQNNNSTTLTTKGELIIDVADGDSYTYGSAFGVNATQNFGNFDTIKNGLGTQQLNNVQVGGSVTVNAGTLTLGNYSGVVRIGSASVTAASLNITEDVEIASTLSVDHGSSLNLSVTEANGSVTVIGATFGPTGPVDLTLDYGLLALGNPTYPGIDVTGLDGFDPSSTGITLNVGGSGFQVGQFQLIKYNNTAALSNIANFALTLPTGVTATLVNNTVDQSIDLDITEATPSRAWSGDTTIDGIGNWDIVTSSNWDANAATYTDSYPSFGTGDNVTFNDSVTDVLAGVAEVNLTTTVSPTSVTVNNTAAAAYVFSGTGKLSGSMALNKIGVGTLTISNAAGTNDYTGGTTVFQGTILAGVDDALPTGGVVTIGGTGTSILELNGKNLTIGGLTTAGDNTRLVQNSDVTNSTLTIDVAGVEDYSYGSNFSSSGTIDLVKNGTGTQRFVKDGFNTVPQSLTVNNGLLVWDTLNATVATATVAGGTLQLGETFSITPIGNVTVNSTASLVFNGSANAASVTADAGSASSLNWKVGNWAGVAGTDWPQIAISGDLTVNPGAASFTVVIDDSSISNFTEANTSFTIATVGGTVTAAASDFIVDQSSFTSGTGTFALSVIGQNLVLDYTAAVSSAYDTWAAGFPSLTGGFDDNDDGDALTNGQEWYFGGSDPLVSDSTGQPITSVVSTGTGTFTFTHLRPTDASGATASYEWSAALENGFTTDGASDGTYTVTLTAGAATPDVAGYESVVVTVTSTPAAPSIFARLVLEMP